MKNSGRFSSPRAPKRTRLDHSGASDATEYLEGIQNVTDLPPELFYAIVSFSNLKEALNLRCTCRLFQNNSDLFHYVALYNEDSALPKGYHVREAF
jgi:hypothetical protein